MPWCKGCGSHHVAPMLWRYATVKAGARLDAERRYCCGKPGRAPAASEAVRRFLRFYGPATLADFAEWAGAREAARAAAVGRAWPTTSSRCRRRARGCSPRTPARSTRRRAAEGIRPAPAGRPVPPEAEPAAARRREPELRKRLFRPVGEPRRRPPATAASVGLWRAKAKGAQAGGRPWRSSETLAKGPLTEEAERVARLRGAELTLVVA